MREVFRDLHMAEHEREYEDDLGGVEAKLAWALNPRLDWTLPGTGQREVLVRSRLQPVRQFPLMLHELGEWVLVDVERYVGADIERYADALGASFLAPDPAFRLAIEGDHPDRLAHAGIEIGATLAHGAAFPAGTQPRPCSRLRVS